MAIGRVDGEIVSLASGPDRGGKEGFKPKGLCCGFILLTTKFEPGEIVYLSDGKRKLKVEIRVDVRPDRSARCSLKTLLG
jgi:aminomethyltransferase